MTTEPAELVDLFIERATTVSAVVVEVESQEEAVAYIAALGANKRPCEVLATVPPAEDAERQRADDTTTRAPEDHRVIAAPRLSPRLYRMLGETCVERGFTLIDAGLRQHLAGVDVGVTEVQYGIADTGTLVLESCDEDLRLATMISEIHVALLRRRQLVASAYEVEAHLLAHMKSGSDYHAFITGASRTADIERALTLGVHGPLALHILLLGDT